MSTIWVQNFTGGLDTRRLEETTKGGTLIRGVDGHINRGGEFEQRAAFAKAYTLPTGTTGLAFTPAGVVVFGSGADPGVPAGVTYQRLQHPDGATKLVRVTQSDLFSGKVYAAGLFEDGQLFHFYDGVRVTDFGSNSAVKPGEVVRTFGRKIHTVNGPNLIYSALANPTSFDTANAGAGFNDLSEQDYGSEKLTAVGQYQNYLAIFSDRTVQIRFMDPDPTLSKAVQSLHNTGTISPRSVTGFGDTDVFYLDASGVRSLRARDSSNAAATVDIGSAIDTLVTAVVNASTDDQVRRAIGLIEPRDGRFWLAIGNLIFVFSYFPSVKVSAWTTYEPGFRVDDMIVFERRVYLRSGNDIYVYGGLGRSFAYDDTAAVAYLPYLDADKPTIKKTLQGVDIACRGSWQVRMGMDPNRVEVDDKIGEVTETTFAEDRIPAQHRATHFSLRLVSQGAREGGGPCVVGSAVIHYAAETDEAAA